MKMSESGDEQIAHTSAEAEAGKPVTARLSARGRQ